MEKYFKKFRKDILGIDKTFETPYGEKKIVYSDWTASGRMYEPIEKRLIEIGEMLGNTHTETTVTGKTMTNLYEYSKEIIKKHVNAGEKDVIISAGSGMTGVVNKLQRILGLKIHEKYYKQFNIPEEDRPVVFITHMEHHSNQTTWIETIAEVVIIEPDNEGRVDLDYFEKALEKYKNRKFKIAAVTACSNVTGIRPPVHEIAKIIHKHHGICFVDYACSAPYVDIDMHPDEDGAHFDAVYFSPHKFLGGPGSTGVVVFNSELSHNTVPDNPGGGTVRWTNPWGTHSYLEDIEKKEDGGTPAFMQTIRAALSIRLKEKMGVENILKREEELLEIIWDRLSKIPNLNLLANNIKDRLGVFSFYIDNLHFNLGVKILNDRFGIQTRGGCSCAGTYGHYLLHINQEQSKLITDKIDLGIESVKPGWIRMSIHPTMTDEEAIFICDSIEKLAANHEEWGKDYTYESKTNEFSHKYYKEDRKEILKKLEI